jgi:transcription elongation factor GreA
LKENSEYHAAKEQQGLIESRIREIENKLADAQVIDATLIEPSGTVIFGTTVGLKDLDERKLISYKIVGEDEADVKLGTISVNSPLSRSLVGKSEGDLVKLETPGGTKEYEILSIKHI